MDILKYIPAFILAGAGFVIIAEIVSMNCKKIKNPVSSWLIWWKPTYCVVCGNQVEDFYQQTLFGLSVIKPSVACNPCVN
jgi:hypothetical protein